MLVQPRYQASRVPGVILDMISGGTLVENPEPGIFLLGHWSFEYCIANLKERYPELGDWKESYGVCDSVEQFKDFYREEVVDSPRAFCVAFVHLRAKDMCPEGGWRWHKWGEYIGTQDPQCEYLYDEPLIQEVFTFSVYELDVGR